MEKGEWKNLREVWIPPLTKMGFQEDIIVRKPVAPLNPEQLENEDATVFIPEVKESVQADATVLIMPETKIIQWIQRKNTGESVRIDKSYFVIGKGNDADYVISDNPTISRKHAAILQREEGYFLEDLDSANGTYVNDTKITGQVKLEPETEFRLARENFVFQTVPEEL